MSYACVLVGIGTKFEEKRAKYRSLQNQSPSVVSSNDNSEGSDNLTNINLDLDELKCECRRLANQWKRVKPCIKELANRLVELQSLLNT